jgi:hypothetical protein
MLTNLPKQQFKSYTLCTQNLYTKANNTYHLPARRFCNSVIILNRFLLTVREEVHTQAVWQYAGLPARHINFCFAIVL